MGAIRFREAIASDAAAIGAVHVAAWREAYRGLLPAPLLDGLTPEARAAMWAEVLGEAAASGGIAVFVAERDGRIVGFASCGRQRDPTLEARGFDGEIGAIYVLAAHHRAGVGRALMDLLARRLLADGRRAASLWVLRENCAGRSFYERLGGAVVAERREAQAGVTLNEVAYGWTALSALIGPVPITSRPGEPANRG